jgi:threonine/homoserine/homoserine lactone efflux protein
MLYVLTVAALCATPGPAVLFVLSQAIQRGTSKSVWATVGILSANAAYFVLSATSLGAILVASYRLFLVIKWLGAAYLIYLGLRCFFGRSSLHTLPNLGDSRIAEWRIWRDGFIVQGANPKALVFFTAILPQFIDIDHSVASQVLILGVSSIVVEFFILLIYGQLAGKALSAANNSRFEKVTNRASGALLTGAGLGIARLKRG